MVKAGLVDHHQQILYPVLKPQLAWHDAFKTVELNARGENDSVNIYYYFKHANLKWKLFKRQGISMQEKHFEHKQLGRSSSKCFGEQIFLPILVGFTNQQTMDPYNQQKKDSKAKLQGLLANNSDIKKIVLKHHSNRHFVILHL